MKLSTVTYVLWAAIIAGHIGLLMVFFFRRNLRTFPVLVGYIAFNAVTGIVLWAAEKYWTDHLYTILWWGAVCLRYPLQIGTIVEISRSVLRPVRAWVRDARKGLWTSGTIGIISAALIAVGWAPSGAKGWILWENRASLFMSLVMSGIIVLLFSITAWLHLQRSRHVFALGLGLFVWSYSSLMDDVGRSILGWNRPFLVVDNIEQTIYLAVLIYWIVVFWEPEDEQPPIPPEALAMLMSLHDRVKYDLEQLEGPRR